MLQQGKGPLQALAPQPLHRAAAKAFVEHGLDRAAAVAAALFDLAEADGCVEMGH